MDRPARVARQLVGEEREVGEDANDDGEPPGYASAVFGEVAVAILSCDEDCGDDRNQEVDKTDASARAGDPRHEDQQQDPQEHVRTAHRLRPFEVEAHGVGGGTHCATTIWLSRDVESLNVTRRPKITSHSASRNSPKKVNEETGVEDPWVSAALRLSNR